MGRKAYAVREGGRPCATHFIVLQRFADHALVEAQPQTGRTHQIRVHLAWLGHPVCGDTLYGGGSVAAQRAAKLTLRRPALHAARLACESLGFDVSAPLPEDLRQALSRLTADSESLMA
jgi:23S rRNA pseudouridine1911/1915/1917 synthase